MKKIKKNVRICEYYKKKQEHVNRIRDIFLEANEYSKEIIKKNIIYLPKDNPKPGGYIILHESDLDKIVKEIYKI